MTGFELERNQGHLLMQSQKPVRGQDKWGIESPSNVRRS